MISASTITNAIGSAASDTNDVLKAPLVGSVDTVHLFLTVGVVMIAVIVWTRILAHIKG